MLRQNVMGEASIRQLDNLRSDYCMRHESIVFFAVRLSTHSLKPEDPPAYLRC
jgi:hypothetical protein